MKKTDVIVIGAGQCGLAMSHELTQAGVDHAVLERGQIANSWRTERWASLRLLTPNWMNGLAGQPYDGNDPDGFMPVEAFVSACEAAATANAAPVSAETSVLEVTETQGGFRVQTDQGLWSCAKLVMANGACARPRLPTFASDLPANIRQLTPHSYKSPASVGDGKVLVVGASASGQQIARELQQAGRDVILSVGSHLRLPRDYRGLDILFWMDLMGLLSIPYHTVDDLDRLRRLPSLTVMGSPDRASLDLNLLQDMGVEITGRLSAMQGGAAFFSGALHNHCTMADQKMGRLQRSIDGWITEHGLDGFFPEPAPTAPTRAPKTPRLKLDLARDRIKTVIWATGFVPDFSWLRMPVFDRKGRLRHDGGVVAPGLYAMGLPYLRTRKSSHIHGAAQDARALSHHLLQSFETRLAA